MPFTATWRQVEITLSEVERKRCVTYIWNLKYNTDESICETETGSQTETKLVAAKGRRVGERRIRSLRSADTNCHL